MVKQGLCDFTYRKVIVSTNGIVSAKKDLNILF